MKTLHVVFNAHLDPAWFWDWREGLNEGIATCRIVLSFLTKYPWLMFSKGEAVIYAHIERYAPELFKQIQNFVSKGRWEIVGGTIIQPDTNLGAGEAYLRQFLYGGHYFKKAFGFVPEIIWNVDSFGHAAFLPMIYRAAGYKFAVQCRPSQKEMPTPGRIFRWRAPDTSEVLTVNLESYGTERPEQDLAFTPSARIERAFTEIPDGLDDWILLLGIGNHGGAISEELIHAVQNAIKNPPKGWIVKPSTARDFFRAVEKNLEHFPIIENKLQHSCRGCYSASVSLKRSIRSAELLVDTAERASSVAEIYGCSEYPRSNIERVWSEILFNHFHDILSGTCTRRVSEESLDQLGKARHESREIINNALLPLALRIDTSSQEGVPILFFNPSAIPWNGPLEVEWMFDYRPTGIPVEHVEAIDSSGVSVPVQLLPPESFLGVQWRFRGVFEASIPSCGYTVYWFRKTLPKDRISQVQCKEDENGISLENDFLVVKWNRGESGIRISEVKSGKEWFTDSGAVGTVVQDLADTWGFGTNAWENELVRFESASALITNQGPIKSSFILKTIYGANVLEQEFSLYASEKKVHCKARVLWTEPRKMLKLVFPSQFDHLVYLTPYGITQSEPEFGELACTGWAAIANSNHTGVGVASTQFFAFDAVSGALRITLLRSPVYCDHRGTSNETKNNYGDFMEIGEHLFEYMIGPEEKIADIAEHLFLLPIAIHTFSHPGNLPSRDSIISIDSVDLRLVSLKKAEDDNGWIVRFWNIKGTRSIGTIKIFGSAIGTIEVEPLQLSTMRIFREFSAWRIEKCATLS